MIIACCCCCTLSHSGPAITREHERGVCGDAHASSCSGFFRTLCTISPSGRGVEISFMLRGVFAYAPMRGLNGFRRLISSVNVLPPPFAVGLRTTESALDACGCAFTRSSVLCNVCWCVYSMPAHTHTHTADQCTACSISRLRPSERLSYRLCGRMCCEIITSLCAAVIGSGMRLRCVVVHLT